MIDAQTLIGLACLIANSRSGTSPADLEASLTDAEKAQVKTLIDSGACLPGGIENLIRATRGKIERGEIEDRSGDGSPSHDCMTGRPGGD